MATPKILIKTQAPNPNADPNLFQQSTPTPPTQEGEDLSQDPFSALDEPGYKGVGDRGSEAPKEEPKPYIPPVELVQKYYDPEYPETILSAWHKAVQLEPVIASFPKFKEMKPEEQDQLLEIFQPTLEGYEAPEAGVHITPMTEPQITMPKEKASSFDEWIPNLLKREGGGRTTNRASDRGGLTRYGVSQKANPDIDVKNLTEEKAKQIYKERYWDKVNGDELPPQTANVLADIAVNSGPSHAKKFAKKIAGENWVTKLTAKDAPKLIDLQEQHYIKLAQSPKNKWDQLENLEGWINRANELRKNNNVSSLSRKDTNNATKSFQEAINRELKKAKIDSVVAIDGSIGKYTRTALSKLSSRVQKALVRAYISSLTNKTVSIPKMKPKKQKKQPPRRYIAGIAKEGSEV